MKKSMKNNDATDMEIQIQINVGQKIRELRKSFRLSSVELSRQTGISQGHLSKIENGKATISIKVLSQLCQFFNRPLNYLFQRAEELPQVLGTLNVGEGPEKEGVKWFAEEIRRNTDQRISLIPLEPYQLGTVNNQVEYLQKGTIDLFIEDLCLLERFIPDFNIFALPFVFSSMENHLRFLNGDFFKEQFTKPLLEKGIRFINPGWNWFRGVRRVLVSKKPIFSPDDVKGLKVRIFESEVLKLYWKNLGAEPVVIPWEKSNRALQNDDIDVMPSYKALLHPLKFCQHAKYVTEIGDISSVQCVAMNESKYQLLSPAIQAAIETACEKAGDVFSGHVEEMDKNDEAFNIKAFNAVYIKGENAPWKAVVQKTRQDLIQQGVVSKEACQEIAKIENAESDV